MRNLILAGLGAVLASCSMDKGPDVDRLMADYSLAGTPGASVMVIQDGEPILSRSYGLAYIDNETPVTPDTSFRLASITKQFTATAVLMLVDESKLALDDSIRTYFPEFPAFTEEVTIRHLLQHTSGIEDYEPIYGDQFPQQVTDAGVVYLISGTDGTYFPPGSEYRYSNSGYAILAVLVERLSGQTFAGFLDTHIFKPLGMDKTLAYQKDISTVPNRAYGYTVSDQGIEFSDQSAWSAVLGDGGVYTSVNELRKWDAALYEGGLLSAAQRAASLTPGLDNYGFGFRIDEYEGHKRIHHSGSTSGFRNFMQRFPEERLTVIVLTNRADPDVAPIAEQIARLYLD
jgi:CubicO group peptidase (beta-lactamase class C family)